MSAPAVAVSSDGKKFAAAWMDKRLGDNQARVYWSISNEPRFDSDAAIHAINSGKQDHPSLVFDRAGTAWAAWEERQGGRQQIWYRSADADSGPQQLSAAADGRASFPVIAAGDGVLAVVYESTGGGGRKVVCRILAR